MSQPSFFSSRAVRIAVLLLLFAAALAIRLYDLTDPPLDFHPTRQLLSAIKARALYFQTQPNGYSTDTLETGIRQAKLKSQVEPVILEGLVAYTYRFTGEQLWVGRVYSSLFWLIGGIFLFLFVCRLLTFEAAFFSTAYYLLFPYAITASRSFQPDPLMVMLIIAFWWAFARWSALTPDPSLRSASQSPGGRGEAAVLAGLLGGAAILVKFSAAFFVIGGALGLGLSRFTWRELLRNGQVWVMAILGALPGLSYLIYGIFIEGGLEDQFSGRFVPDLLFNPLNYLQWMVKVDLATGGLFIMLGLLGFFLINDKRFIGLLFGVWGAYILYGLYFNYHVATHDYYHLPLIPVLAVSLGPLGGWFFARLAGSTVQGVQRGAATLILVMGLVMVLWNVRNQMKAEDYRPEAAMWTEVATLIEDESVIALIQDYGSALEYWGLRTVPIWPYTGDPLYTRIQRNEARFEEMFADYSSRKEFFLVTDFDELSRQTQLRERLNNYPVYMEGDGFVIFDLRNASSN